MASAQPPNAANNMSPARLGIAMPQIDARSMTVDARASGALALENRLVIGSSSTEDIAAST